ncbi:hypothetical protein ACQJBY_049551 [Aegilops geniculata]
MTLYNHFTHSKNVKRLMKQRVLKFWHILLLLRNYATTRSIQLLLRRLGSTRKHITVFYAFFMLRV